MSGHKNIRAVVLGTDIEDNGIALRFAVSGAGAVLLGRTIEKANTACAQAATFASELSGDANSEPDPARADA